jgi:transporter family protein
MIASFAPFTLVLRNHLIPHMALSGLSGLATDLSWLCYFRALQLGEASRVAPMDKLSVLFAIVFAAVVLRETLAWHQWFGGGLVLAGAVILAFK